MKEQIRIEDLEYNPRTGEFLFQGISEDDSEKAAHRVVITIPDTVINMLFNIAGK